MKVRSAWATRLVVVSLAGLAFALPGTAFANNSGDIWLDTVGEPAGPGHSHNPHLPCADINLWGAKMADSGDRYTIDGWNPTGEKERAYSHSWSYDKSEGGSQVLDVIDVETLIANAVANGDTPHPQQGYHFKIQFVQDPQKHKVFWVECAPPGPQGECCQPPPPGGDTQGGTTETTTTQGTTESPAVAPQQQVLGERVAGGKKATKKAKKKRKVKAKRKKRKTKKRLVLPIFTG
jgi:hypothetical protein